MDTKDKKQWNARIRKPLICVVDSVRKRNRWSHDDLAELALAALFGCDDAEMVARQDKARKAFRELGLTLPFNDRWPSAKSNSDQFVVESQLMALPRPERKKAGAIDQLADRLHGMQEVADSTSAGSTLKKETGIKKAKNKNSTTVPSVVKLGPNVYGVFSNGDMSIVGKRKLPSKFIEKSFAE